MAPPIPPASPSPRSPWAVASAPDRPSFRSPLRWANHAIVALLAAAIVLLLFAFAPALSRDLGLSQTKTVSGPLAGSRKIGEPSLAERLLAMRDDPHAGIGLGRDRGTEPGEATDEDPAAAQPAETLKDIIVYAFPTLDAPAVGVAREGDPVQIVRELQGWAEVRYQGPRGPSLGWVPRSALRVR